MGIRYVGETVAKKLSDSFGNINSLRIASFEDLCSVDEIGDKIAESILDFFSQDYNNKIIDQLLESGLVMEVEIKKDTKHSTILKNKKIVISGTFKNTSREELKTIIEENGGKNTSTVSKTTSILVAGENMGPSKLEKATKNKVEILNESEFFKLLEELQANDKTKQIKQGELF